MTAIAHALFQKAESLKVVTILRFSGLGLLVSLLFLLFYLDYGLDLSPGFF